MKTKTELFFTMLFVALASALVTYYFVQPVPQVNVAQVQQSIQNGKKLEQTIEKNYAVSLQKLQKENDSLKKLADYHTAALSAATEKVSQLENSVNTLAEKAQAEPDTAKDKVADLDSLGGETVSLIKQEDEKSSLCDSAIHDLTAQVSEKDSVIKDCNTGYVNMKQALDTSLAQQGNMLAMIKSLNKQVSHKGRQSRFLSAGILILSGISATLYLTRKP